MARIVTIPTTIGGNEIDVTKCMPFNEYNGNKQVAQSSVFETLYSVAGKGFLSEAILMNWTSNTGTQIKITIDGTIVVHLAVANIYRFIGISQYQNLFGVSSTGVTGTTFSIPGVITTGNDVDIAVYPARRVTNYPFPDANMHYDYMGMFSSPLYFKTSLLVEILCGNITDTLRYRVQGGKY